MIGQHLKLIRKTSGRTIKEIAELTGLSISYISNIERNATSPTVEQLQTICKALEIDMINFLAGASDFSPLVRKEDRRPVNAESHKITYDMVDNQQQSMRATSVVMDKDYHSEVITYGHAEDELCIVVRGEILMRVDQQDYILKEGDCMYVKANTPHRFRKACDGEAEVYNVKLNR